MNPSRFLPSGSAPRLPVRSHLQRACALALAALGLQAGASAASFYWFGDNNAFWNTTTGPGGTNWSSSGDFNNGTAGIPGASDDVFFVLAGAGNLSTQLGADFSIRSLTFTPDATLPISIGGSNTLTLGTGGITDNAPTAAITLDTAIALGATQTWNNNSTVALTVNGIISGAGTNNLTLGGTGGFTFTNASTYSGSTTLFTGALTLSGNGSLLNTSGVTLNAGTSLTLDNTTTSVANRLSDSTTFLSRGGILNFIGNAAGTNETLGSLGVASGASVVQTSGTGSSLTLGTAGSISSFTRTTGGTVLFAVGAGSSVKAPNVTLTNGIIGGWAVTGTAGGTGLNFATTDGSGNIIPFAGYTTFNNSSVSTDNAKYDAVVNTSINLTADTTVNSLYLTGGTTPITGPGIVPPANYLTNGNGSATPVRAYYNGITFSNGASNAQTVTLTIGAGGIISSGATGVGHYNNKADIGNMAFIGYLFDESGGADGRITAGAGLSDLIVYTDSNLRIASIIVDNGAPVGLTKSGPGLLDISNGNTQNFKHNNTFTGKITINEGILLINAAGQLGSSAAASDNVTFNGGELRTFAGLNTNAAQGWTVGTRGGIFTYTGGGNSSIQNKITGVGGFSYYARQTGGGGGATIHLNNVRGTGSIADHDYQGPTNFWFSYGDGNTGGTDAGTENIIFDANDQVPHNSAVSINMVQDTAAHTIVPNINAKAINFNGKNLFFGSLAGNVDIANHNGALTLGGNNLSTAYTGKFAGGTGSLTKIGSGIQTLSGVNTYTGATNINGGTLLIGTGTGLTGAGSLGTSVVTVGNGSLVGALGGNGTINGTVTVTSTGQLAPAMSSTTFNTLTINDNLTINPGGTLSYNFGTPGNGDRITLAGTGSLNLQAGADILNVTQLPGFGIGTYPLIVVAGSGSFTDNATFTVNGRTNFNYFVLKPGDAIDATAGGGTVPVGQLYLEVLQGNPNLTWIGNLSGNWDTTTANWSGDASLFTTGANVTFDDFGSARPSVNVSAPGVTANSITFANSAVNYAFGGSPISVTAGSGIVKNQAGTVTFNNSVATALTTINAGTISVAGTLNSGIIKVNGAGALNVSGALGSTNALNVAGTVTFTSGAQTLSTLSNDSGLTTGVVNLNGPTALTLGSGGYDGAIKGTGSLVKTSNGLLTLTNATSNFAGGIAIQQGTVSIPSGLDGGAPGPLGISTASIILGAAGTAGSLQYTGSAAITTRGFTLSGGGGSIEMATLGQLLTVNGTIDNGTSALTLTGVGDGLLTTPLAGAGNITKQGAGTWTLAGTSSASGAAAATLITVGAGSLTAMSGGTFSTLGAAAVTLSGGVLGLSSTAPATFDNAINVAQSATINAFMSLPGGGVAAQTVSLGGTNNVTIAAGRVLTTTTADNYTLLIGGNVGGGGGLTSNGTVSLTGSTVNYTGPTVVSGGVFTAVPLVNGTSSVTVNGGALTANAGITTAGAITTNNNGTLNLGGPTSTSTLTVNNTSTVNSSAALTVSGLTTVNGGTLTNNVSLSTNNLIILSGTYNGNGTLTSPNGLTINAGTARISATDGLSTGPITINGGTLKFDAGFTTTTYLGSSVQNDGTIQAATGIADLGTTIITTTKPHATPGTSGVLSERFFRPADAGTPDFTNNQGDPGITFDVAPNFATRTPGASDTLGGGVAINFTGANIQTRANAVVANFYANTDNEGVAWLGRLTVGGPNLLPGPISFGTNSDDGSTIYVDLNRDGVFQANERVIGNAGSHGLVTVTNTVTLAAGIYNIAIGWYNGTGGQQIDAKFLPGSGVAFAAQTFINPGIQTDIFSAPATPGGRIQVDAGATLLAGGFTADVLAFTSGSGAGSLVLKPHVTAFTSNADFINMTGNAPVGGIDLESGNSLNVVTLNLGTNGVLTKDGVGTLTITGPGIGTGEFIAAGGITVVNGSISGAVTVNGGRVRGLGTIGTTQLVDGFLEAGQVAGILNTGPLTFNGGTVVVDINGNTTSTYDQLNVAGAVTFNNSTNLSLLFASYDPQDNQDKFVIINNDSTDAVSLNGPFSHFFYNSNELLEGTIFSATSGANTQLFQITYAGGDGNDVVLSAVPEPTTSLTLLAGLATLTLRRRQK